MTQREKGVATLECATCGKELPAEEQADGGLAASACPSCTRKANKAEKAAEDESTGREKATNVKESEK